MKKIIHGDYQTPLALARDTVAFVKTLVKFTPTQVVEPTCGEGSFVVASASVFPDARVRGYEMDEAKVSRATPGLPANAKLSVANFFSVDWAAVLEDDACLVVGNPPWVAVSRLGELGSENRPAVALKLGHSGMDSKTGASNFDIAEYMALTLAKELAKKPEAAMALLLKASSVRRLAVHLQTVAPADIHFFRIDGKKHFGVSVACGLLFVDFAVRGSEPQYFDYATLDRESLCRTLTVRGRHLVAANAEDVSGIVGQKFRSGVKHDAAEVLELAGDVAPFTNKRNELVDIPNAAVFPFIKSSGLGCAPHRSLVVPPTGLTAYAHAGDIPSEALLAYLALNKHVFARRKSSVYSKLDEFSIFGIGPYTFKPWKVAISAFSKVPAFHVIGPHRGKPVLFDDTVYFLSFESEAEAWDAHEKLTREESRNALAERIFKEDMRSVKAKVLNDLFCR